MAGIIKTNVGKIQSNPIGAVAGAGAAFWAVKKYTNTRSWWLIAGAAIVGGVVGANVSSMLKTKMNTPTAKDTK